MSIKVPVQARKFIEREVPRKYRSRIPALISDAYALAEQLTHDVDIFNWKLGHNHVGYLKRIAVEYMLKKAIDEGKLPFMYKINSNKNKSSWHLEIETDNAIITTSQVQSKRAIARPAYFRDKLQEANQLSFTFGSNTVDIKNEPYHLLLTHGYNSKTPSFINLGFPNQYGWVDYINLLTEPILVENHSKQENDTKELLVDFKEFTKEVTNNAHKQQF